MRGIRQPSRGKYFATWSFFSHAISGAPGDYSSESYYFEMALQATQRLAGKPRACPCEVKCFRLLETLLLRSEGPAKHK